MSTVITQRVLPPDGRWRVMDIVDFHCPEGWVTMGYQIVELKGDEALIRGSWGFQWVPLSELTFRLRTG